MSETFESQPSGLPPSDWGPPPSPRAARSGASADLPSGTGLGKYRILERLRATHNAVIYRARDQMLDRLVSIKQMSPQRIDDPVACGEFRREAQLLARIRPEAKHLVGILELIEDNYGLFIVQDHAEGRSLESLISKRQLDGEKTLQVLGTAALALKSLHDLNIVHRNLCPANVLVADGVGCRLSDLSSAALEGDCSPPPTFTAKYAAPELLAGWDYDDRIDLYALGIILFEMCVGRQAMHRHFSDITRDPASADENWRAWHLNYDAALPDPALLNPSIPSAICYILRRLTAKDLDERFGAIDDVINALTAFFRARRQDQARRLQGPAPVRLIGSTAAPAAQRVSAFGPAGLPGPSTLARSQQGIQAAPTRTQIVTTQRVLAPTARDAEAAQDPYSNFPQRPIPAGKTMASRRRRALPAPPKPMVAVAPVPVPEPVVESVRDYYPRQKLAAALVFIIVIASVSAVAAWTGILDSISKDPARAALVKGQQLFLDRNFDGAREQLRRSSDLAQSKEHGAEIRAEAARWLLLADAEISLERDELALAGKSLNAAEQAGADRLALDDLRRRFKAKTEMLDVAGMLESKLASNDFDFDTVEQRLKSLEESDLARIVDTSDLKDRLEKSKAKRKYHEAIRAANAALERNEFAQALVSCAEAGRIEQTEELSRLETRIKDMKARFEWILRGDHAFYESDFKEAEECYDRANRLKSSREIEDKAKVARAHVLLGEARQAIDDGDLILAEQKFRSSAWNHPLPEAVLKLERMAPAFEAARWVQQADRARESGETAEARRLYDQALPRLSGRARELVVDKLQKLSE